MGITLVVGTLLTSPLPHIVVFGKASLNPCPTFRSYTKLSLGSGNKLRFWLDPWASSQLLSNRFPHFFQPFHIERTHYVILFLPVFLQGYPVCRNLRDLEIEKFLSLSALIHQFHPSLPLQILEFDPFLVSLLYPLSSKLSPSFLLSFPHRFIWFSLPPSKVQSFSGRLRRIDPPYVRHHLNLSSPAFVPFAPVFVLFAFRRPNLKII